MSRLYDVNSDSTGGIEWRLEDFILLFLCVMAAVSRVVTLLLKEETDLFNISIRKKIYHNIPKVSFSPSFGST